MKSANPQPRGTSCGCAHPLRHNHSSGRVDRRLHIVGLYAMRRDECTPWRYAYDSSAVVLVRYSPTAAAVIKPEQPRETLGINPPRI
jgi:hypothetical protein